MSGEHKPIMKKRWALDHSEFLGFYYEEDPRGRCRVPGCPNGREKGEPQLIERYIVRSPTSGDVAEIGWVCHGHWCDFHGEPLEPRFLEYLRKREISRDESKKGQKIVGTLRKLLVDWGKRNPGKKMFADEVQKLREEAKEADRIEELKRRGKIHSYDFPIGKFKNLKEAREWAKERDGFVTLPNPVTIRDEELWRVYVLLEKVSKE